MVEGASREVQSEGSDRGDVLDRPMVQKQSSLGGIYRLFGYQLKKVDNVPGKILFHDGDENIINGTLVTHDANMRVRFQASQLNSPEFSDLLKAVRAGGPNFSQQMKVSGRPWVEENGSIVLLVRSFDIQK